MGEDLCDTKLSLAINGGGFSGADGRRLEAMKLPVRLLLSFPPFLKKEADEDREEKAKSMELGNLDINKSKNKREDSEDRHGGMITRKKLRLSNEQSAVLERSFYSNNNLSSVQKEELAQKLGLRPRQVEVWFQNRRARTKLKQTEVDCELLKRWCETLTDENRRLRRELNELRFYGSKIEANKVCPSCERLTAHEENQEKTSPVLQLCS